MDRESFLETVKNQYVDEIRVAFLECEHHGGRVIDYSALNQRLKKLMVGAKKEGISPRDFQLLVQAVLPHVFEQIALGEGKRAA
jgi:hypothetical protein